MTNFADFKVNLNQNLWGLLLSLLALGAAEYFGLKWLFFFGIILSTISSISFAVTLAAYTCQYVKKRIKNYGNK